jgi:hypothetical protein
MTVKDRLHQLVDELPDGKIAEFVLVILDEAWRMDPATAEELLDYAHWLSQPEDTLTDEERDRVETGKAEIAKGDYVSLEELRRKLAL